MIFKSLPVRGAWIEILYSSDFCNVSITSLPVRGAWIEITSEKAYPYVTFVAPCEGSVD